MKKTRPISIIIPVATLACVVTVNASTDYGPARWMGVCGASESSTSGNWYTSGYGKRFFVIHDIEGYYQNFIYNSRHCIGRAGEESVHYAANGKDDGSADPYPAGDIAQMVRDKYYAWHARCWNQYSIGTEHEGFVSNPAWFTEAMYQSSASLTRSKCDKFGIPKNRDHIIAHGQKSYSWWVSWMRSAGYSDSFIFCNTHSDPGPYWDWNHYMDLVNGIASKPSRPTSLSAKATAWNHIDLKWQDNSSNENGFEIQKSSGGSDGPWNTIHNNGANDHNYTVGSLNADTTYWFRVRAYNAAGNSDWSGVAHDLTFNRYPPDAPSNCTATANNDDKITVAWADNSSNEDNFIISQSTDAVTWTAVRTNGANTTSYAVTGLKGNRTYYFRVKARNEAGSSAWSNTASDTTPPTAPSNLVASKGTGFDKINVTWDDNSGAEAGFKIERATASNGPWTQVATNAASDPTYTDIGLAPSSTYWYRVRSYNANGNSAYSNVDSGTTGNQPPTIATIGNKTVAAGTTLKFRVTSTDPNQNTGAQNLSGFQTYTVPTADGTVLFRSPDYANITDQFLDTSVTNYTKVVSTQPTGNGSTKAMKAQFTFLAGSSDYWVRLPTAGTANLPNPVISLNQSVRFKVYSTKSIKLGIAVRETTNNPAIGDDGGTDGPIEYVGVTNIVGTTTPMPTRTINASTWTTVTFNCQKDPAFPATDSSDPADGIIKTGKGVFQSVEVVGNGGTGAYTVYFDDFDVLTNNTLDFTLDAGAPATAAIGKFNGDFTWTPTTADVGNHIVTVRVTDQLGMQDTETFTITVTSTGNNQPALTTIGNKTVKESTALTFTATATDPDAGQSLTYSLDAGAPAGATIGATTGAFSWTPSEAQGAGTYPITVRVTDNGSPVASDFETITVTVSEVNVAPTISAITDKTVTEGGTFSFTPTASDADLPANTLTWSLITAPSGMTINSSSGALSWTTGEDDGPDTNQISIRVTDNGSPKLWADRTFNLIVNEANTAPVLTVSNAASTRIDLTDFENYQDGSYNGTIMFRQPSYSSSTSAFLDTSTANETTVTTNSPGTVRSSVMQASFAFKTGQTNPWLRLTTHNPFGTENALPNPTVDLGKHVTFDIYANKSIKICLGIRETGTQVPIGYDGGTTGGLEFVGATGKNGGAPICTRTIAANTWTTVDFDLPNEPATAFTGDGVLAAGKGVLEEIAIVPNGGSGVHNIYLDNFVVTTSSTNLTVNTGEEITLRCTATDADLPPQLLTFSLDAGAPTNAAISEDGVFTWTPTPEQSPSTNNITIRVTDDGPGNLSASKLVTIKVAKVNTPPLLSRPLDIAIELGAPSQQLVITNEATDEDLPAQTLTYSLTGTVPSGATINSSSGVFTWTPPTSTLTTNIITVRVTDNGNPPLYNEQQFAVTIVPVNTAPTLSLGTASVSEPFATYETFANNTANGVVMFKAPNFSTTTSQFIDTQTNYTRVTNSFPAGNPNTSSVKAMVVKWNFKTGTTDYWVRLTTTNAASLPNPTIDLGAHVRFNIQSSKAIKVGLGIRETGTTAEIGANGGVTGGIEWIGVTNKVGANPIPNRLVPANTWTTLDFNLPVEPCTNFSGGNSILATGKGVLEHLILRGEGGTGAYTVYVDDFQVVNTQSLPGTVTMKAASTLTFSASATDPDPGTGLTYGLDADFAETHTNAIMNETTGAFTWTPGATDVGTTNNITVLVSDDPTNNGIPKSASQAVTVIVNADAFAAQSASSGAVSADETVNLAWAAIPGTTYTIQYKESADAENWTDLATVVADSTEASFAIANEGSQRYYRIVETSAGSANE